MVGRIVISLLSVLAIVPLSAQMSVQPGQTVSGRLGEGDAESPSGHFYDRYVIRGRPGQRVLVEMQSEEFDNLLGWGAIVDGNTWQPILVDDNGAGWWNSRLSFTLPQGGTYELRAFAVDQIGWGTYELRVSAVASPVPTRVTVGESIEGALTEADYPGPDGYEDHYIVSANPGDVITILAGGGSSDAFLRAGSRSADGIAEHASDDDSGPGTAAQLVMTVDSTGEAYVIVHSYYRAPDGSYMLEVRPGALDPADDDLSSRSRLIGGEMWGSYEGPVVAEVDVEGRLGDKPGAESDRYLYFRDYTYQAYAGERLRIFVWSDDVDPFVSIGRGLGGDFRAMPEDKRNRALRWTLPISFRAAQPGVYTIRVTSQQRGDAGEFVLVVESAH